MKLLQFLKRIFSASGVPQTAEALPEVVAFNDLKKRKRLIEKMHNRGPGRPPGSLSRAWRCEAVKMNKEGFSNGRIAITFAVSEAAVRDALFNAQNSIANGAKKRIFRSNDWHPKAVEMRNRGMTYNQIAVAMGKSRSSVKQAIRRAVEKQKAAA